jgi:hypothetical protein
MRRRTHTAAETDCFEARRWYCYLGRAGVSSRIKRQARRRERREGRRAATVDRWGNPLLGNERQH